MSVKIKGLNELSNKLQKMQKAAQELLHFVGWEDKEPWNYKQPKKSAIWQALCL